MKDPTENIAACEDFFLLVVEAHILSAAMTVFGMKCLEDEPSKQLFPEASSELDRVQRMKVMMLAVSEVLDKFVDLSYNENKPTTPPKDEDHVHAYACNLLSSGLLLMEFVDAIREGDGSRIIRCWKYFLLHFKEANRKNYSIEAFHLLAQYHFLLSPRMAMQLMWSRTVNIHGRSGKNVPCDLHLEHLNKEAKQSIAGLGSNITEEAVLRIGKSIGHTVNIVKRFDEVNKIKQPSSAHTRKSCKKDMELLIKELFVESKVFNKVPGRRHHSFPTIPPNPTKYISSNDINAWMKEQLKKLIMYRPTT